MHLPLYPFEHGKDEERFPWDSLIAAFAPARIASVEGREWSHWVLEHPVQPVQLYAPAYGEPARTVGFVSFDGHDVIELGHEGARSSIRCGAEIRLVRHADPGAGWWRVFARPLWSLGRLARSG